MSAILSSDDLNDFISPGVACIKPVETLPADPAVNPYEVSTEDKLQASNPAPASISLTDCLACSGCVTSAEAVLVSLQSHSEVLNTLNAHPSFDLRSLSPDAAFDTPLAHSPDAKIFVASVSPQVRASLAATYGISDTRAGWMIDQFLVGPGGLARGGNHGSNFSYVVDTNRMRTACLVLGADEVAQSCQDTKTPRPILTSACPGWVCYAEKTHPHVLQHLSKLKSPQALTGIMLKSVLSKHFGVHPSQIWHLALMPCFDKKLEASRSELTDRWWHDDQQSEPVRDVDCVITTRELLTLANARSIALHDLPSRPLSKSNRTPFPDPPLDRFLFPRPRRRSPNPAQSSDAGTSGGYLHHILKSTQALNPGSTILTQRGRNADVTEYTLLSASSEPVLKCARYYGFRNIQNLVRKLKPPRQSKLPGATARKTQAAGTSDYAYVEVMACPGGCTNGGGQVKIEDVEQILPLTRGEEVSRDTEVEKLRSQKEWLKRVDEAYFSAEDEDEFDEEDTGKADSDEDTEMTGTDGEFVHGINTREVHDVLQHWSDVTGVPLDKLVYTTFRKVESDVGKKKAAKNMGDSERIAAIAGMSGGGW